MENVKAVVSMSVLVAVRDHALIHVKMGVIEVAQEQQSINDYES